VTEVQIVLVILFVGITAYAVLAGADFGAGFWDLVAGGAGRGRRQRVLIEQSLGPVWETNHVWLILVLVVLWTCFPVAFGSIMSTLFIPLTLVAVGIILRGSGFAFRRLVPTTRLQRLYGAMFAASSVLTPFFLGAVAGGIASGRIPVGNARGNPITSWLNPSGVLGGTLAVLTCAFLAAVYLAADASRRRLPDLPEAFRSRAMVLGAVTGVVAVAGIFVLRADAIAISNRLFSGRALPLAALSGVGGVVAMYLLWVRRFTWARVAAALAVTCVVWGWGVGQYPYILEGTLTVYQAAAPGPTLTAMIVSLGVGALLLIPSFGLLYTLNAQDHLAEESAMEDPTDRPSSDHDPTDTAPQEGPRVGVSPADGTDTEE
jgi:cytochrome d ubiquinol oxidase subunit II